jgi:crossover junction endodeoxyribonuclease RuvC
MKFMTTYNLRVLGIDPGTATTGWAIIEMKGNAPHPLGFGFISTDKNKTEEERLLEISKDLQNIIKKYKPGEAAVEKLFFFKNQKTIIQVAQARGVILLTLKQKSVKISSYTPLQVKQAITGYGRAGKKQIQDMTKNILRLKSLPAPDDVSDAIAIAICHLNSRVYNNLNK